MIDSGLLQTTDTKDIDGGNPLHRAIVVGKSTLGVTGGSVEDFLAGHKRIADFICSMEEKFGRFPSVRIRNDIFWDAVRDAREPGCGMSWRNFSALCAVYSILGDKSYMRICRDRIIAAALGCKSSKIMPRMMRHRQDRAKALTVKELRITLDKLEKEGFFCRAHPSRRRTYFSNQIPAEELGKLLFDVLSKPDRLTQRRLNDQKLQADIRAVKANRALSLKTPAMKRPAGLSHPPAGLGAATGPRPGP